VQASALTLKPEIFASCKITDVTSI